MSEILPWTYALITTPLRVLYLDQNAWIALARGAWDATAYPDQHAALTRLVGAVQAERIVVPLSHTNIYETAKINDPVRRSHLARVQVSISRGMVVRSRRRILEETILRQIAKHLEIEAPALAEGWFLSDLWFETAADYTPETFGQVSEGVLKLLRQNPAYALFDYLTELDDAVRIEGVQKYSASSVDLISRLEARRDLVAGQPFTLRLRAYGAQLLIDEFDFILLVAKRLGLNWSTVRDIGPRLLKSLVADVPVMNVERELVVRLEDQARSTTENDLRDMASFVTMLPLADVFVGEKPFVNLARQARLGEKYSTILLTSLLDLTDDMLLMT